MYSDYVLTSRGIVYDIVTVYNVITIKDFAVLIEIVQKIVYMDYLIETI